MEMELQRRERLRVALPVCVSHRSVSPVDLNLCSVRALNCASSKLGVVERVVEQRRLPNEISRGHVDWALLQSLYRNEQDMICLPFHRRGAS